MVYTRSVRSQAQRARCVAVLVMALASAGSATLLARQDLPASAARLATGWTARDVPFSSPVDRTITLRVFAASVNDPRSERVVDVARASLALLGEWLGPFPGTQLSIVTTGWPVPDLGPTYPGVVAAPTRWLTIAHDGAADRVLIASIARQYWFAVHQPNELWFEDGLMKYTADRAIDALLQGRQFWTRRFFGGMVPFSVRSLPLSPPRSAARGRIPQFDDPPDNGLDPRATAVAAALHTLERYLGWPALQQGLVAYRERFRFGGGTPAALLAILNEQGAQDLGWFFTAAFRPATRFDYAVDEVASVPEGAQHRVIVSLRRVGDGVFAGSSQSRDRFTAPAIAVVLTMADGTEVREWWDGRDPSRRLEYLSAAPLESAVVDPDRMLLLDADRSNNARRLLPAPPYPPARRAVVSWMVWLQNWMLACTALA